MEIDMLPDLCHAFALTPSCHKTLDALYSARRGACHRAYAESRHKNSPALKKGRAEHQILSDRALGVMEAYANEPKSVARLLRSADRSLYDRVQASSGPINTKEMMHEISVRPIGNNQYFNMLLFMYADISLAGCGMLDDTLATMIAAFYQNEQLRTRATKKPDMELVREARIFFKNYVIADVEGLLEVVDEAGKKELERLFMISERAGVDITEYACGIELDSNDLAVALMDGPDNAYTKAALLCTFKAMQKDRQFCIDLAANDKRAENESLRSEISALKRELRDQDKRIALSESVMRNAMRDAERSNTRLEAEQAEHVGDAQEIAALRNALYAAQAPDDEQVRGEESREVPDGVVCVGGSEAWARGMRESHPNLAIYAADVTPPDSAVIQGATEIWFRADYLAHSEYYRVSGIARRHGVPVMYFSSSGVRRCAEELSAKR